MSILITLVAFLLTIGFIVLIHEGGHFLAAKLTGMWIHELAIGIGPALVRFRIKETQYSLRLFPIGGYVRVAGDETSGDEDAQVPKERLFPNRPPLFRMTMVSAGPLMNVIAAVVIMVSVVGLIGVPYLEVSDLIGGSPSEGILKPGDRILRVGERPIYFARQLQAAVQQRGEAEEPVRIEVRRGDQILNFSLQPVLEEGRYIIGVYFTASEATQRVPFPTNLGIGLLWVKNVIVAYYLGLKGIFTGEIPAGEALTGPVGIASIVGQFVAQGLLPFLTLVAFLNLVIGFLNLIPFPGLDGSRLGFISYELIRGRPIPPEREGLIHYIGYIILLGLMVLITYNDILRLIRGD